MTDLQNNVDVPECGPCRCYRPIVLAVISFILVLAFFILREYWSHLLGFASYLLLIICPLLHLFQCHGCYCCRGTWDDGSRRGGCCR